MISQNIFTSLSTCAVWPWYHDKDSTVTIHCTITGISSVDDLTRLHGYHQKFPRGSKRAILLFLILIPCFRIETGSSANKSGILFQPRKADQGVRSGRHFTFMIQIFCMSGSSCAHAHVNLRLYTSHVIKNAFPLRKHAYSNIYTSKNSEFSDKK